MHDLLSAAGRDWAFITTGVPGSQRMQPYIVSARRGEVLTANGAWIRTDYGFDDCPQPDAARAIKIDEDRQFIVRRVTFTGATKAREERIRRELLIKEGQVFNSILWELSLLHINQLGYFEEIKSQDVQIRPSAAEPKLDINVTVKEKKRK